MKKLEPQVCFMCLSGIFSRFWPKDFSFRQAWGNWFLCVMRNFLSNFFRFKKCFLSKLSSNIKQKNFQISEKKFCRISNSASYYFWSIFWCEFLKRVHSDKKFELWRERTKNYLILLKITSFFLRTAFCFFRASFAFFWKKIQTLNQFANLSKKTRNFCKISQKSFQTAFHISRETMRENWVLQKSPHWILSKKRSDLWKFQIPFFLKLSDTITSF